MATKSIEEMKADAQAVLAEGKGKKAEGKTPRAERKKVTVPEGFSIMQVGILFPNKNNDVIEKLGKLETDKEGSEKFTDAQYLGLRVSNFLNSEDVSFWSDLTEETKDIILVKRLTLDKLDDESLDKKAADLQKMLESIAAEKLARQKAQESVTE